MSLNVVAPRGVEVPRFRSVPPAVTNAAGDDAIELAASAGLILDPWQCNAMRDACGETPDGRWAAFEVCLITPRQNGKDGLLEARQLAGLFLFGSRLILHSAHEFKTAQEAFRRILALVTNYDHLRKRVARVRTSHGEEGIELTTGARLRFVARSTGSGRGFSGDDVILNEAYNLSADAMAALLPTMSARPNPQLWYTSSAPLITSGVLRALAKRGRSGRSESLCYLDYCADGRDLPKDYSEWNSRHPAVLRAMQQANPALGIRIFPEFIDKELQALGRVEAERERFGIYDYPDDDTEGFGDAFAELTDPDSDPDAPVAFAVEVTPDRSRAVIVLAGRRADGLVHLEVVDQRPGTAWIGERLHELDRRWGPCANVIDPGGPAGSLIVELEDEHGLQIEQTTTRQFVQACGAFHDGVIPPTPDEPESEPEPVTRYRHRGQQQLLDAAKAARWRKLGDSRAWDRMTVEDSSPLTAATLAAWGLATYGSDATGPNVW